MNLRFFLTLSLAQDELAAGTNLPSNFVLDRHSNLCENRNGAFFQHSEKFDVHEDFFLPSTTSAPTLAETNDRVLLAVALRDPGLDTTGEILMGSITAANL